MIAIDTNILVYVHRAESTFNAEAFNFPKSLAEGSQPWAIVVPCLHEFLVVVTNPRFFNPAISHEQALAQIDTWVAAPGMRALHSDSQHGRVLSDLARKAKLRGGQFHDARGAAIWIENGVSVLCSADRDFGRFKALKTVNPLV